MLHFLCEDAQSVLSSCCLFPLSPLAVDLGASAPRWRGFFVWSHCWEEKSEQWMTGGGDCTAPPASPMLFLRAPALWHPQAFPLGGEGPQQRPFHVPLGEDPESQV